MHSSFLTCTLRQTFYPIIDFVVEESPITNVKALINNFTCAIQINSPERSNVPEILSIGSLAADNITQVRRAYFFAYCAPGNTQ